MVDRRAKVVALSVALAAVGGPASGGAEPAASVPFVRSSGLLFVEVTWTGRAPLLALLDTGASASAIDPAVAAHLPVERVGDVVGTTGSFRSEVVRVGGLRLGGVKLPTVHATRRSLGGLLAPPGSRVDLILGSDALARGALTIDFDRGHLALEAKASPENEARAVPLSLDNGIPSIPASLGGIEVQLRIDTGASLFESDDVYVNVPEHVWAELRGRHPVLAPSSRLQGTGADGRSVELPVVSVPGVEVGPLALDAAFIIVQPVAGYFAAPEAKGFVGNNYLEKLGRVTIDYRGQRLFAGSLVPRAGGARRPGRAS